MNFQEANKVVHKVEDQWHYPILVAAGFVPCTMEGVGFVRHYLYEKGSKQIICVTGAHCDYWTCDQDNARGYWTDLAPFLKRLA